MDPISMIGMGTGLLGGIFSAFGKTETKDTWKKNPNADKFEGMSEQFHRQSEDRAQNIANLGAFKDAQTNMAGNRAAMGNLMQSGGAYSGSLLNAGFAGDAVHKATNYGNTMQGAADAAGMRMQNDSNRMNQSAQFSDMHALQQERNPDFLSRMGTALSGAVGGASKGADQGSLLSELFKKRGGTTMGG